MENPAQFDLNAAILRWRKSLERSPALRAQDLEELECHLADSVKGLESRGLVSEEAFFVAVRRLGSNHELEGEFGKLNPQRVWAERAVWMLSGLLAAYVLWAVVGVLGNMVLNVGLWEGVDVRMVSGLYFLIKLTASAALIGLGFPLLTRQSHELARAVRAALQRPVWTGIGLILALEGVQLLPRYAMRWLEPLWQQVIANPGRAVPQQSQDVLNAWFLWGGLATELLWIASVPLLAGYVWRKSRPARSFLPAAIVAEMGPDKQDAVTKLQAQGLSLDEAMVLVNFRQQGTSALWQDHGSSRRRIWLERGFWMFAGAVLGRIFSGLVSMSAFVLLAAGGEPASGLIQHLAGVGSICLSLGLIAATFLVLPKGVLRCQRQLAWVGSFCCSHPVLAALFSGILWVTVHAAFYFLAPILPHRGVGLIGSRWWEYCSLLSNLIAPSALLVWLASRRSRAMQQTG